MQVPCRGSVERIGESEFGGIPQRAQVGSAPGSWVFLIQKKRDLVMFIRSMFIAFYVPIAKVTPGRNEDTHRVRRASKDSRFSRK